MNAKFLFVCAALALAACGDAAENNTTNNTTANNTTANNTTPNNTTANNTTANNTTANNTTTPVAFTADVVPILTGAGCATAGCHLDPGNGTSFMIAAPAGATEFQAALDGISTGGGRALVAGGNLNDSELYLRITGTGVPKMPFGGSLADGEITTITNWIEQGGTFD